MERVIYADDYVDPVARAFGERVKRGRLTKGWIQGRLAEVMRSTASYVSVIEHGKANPTLDVIVKFARALDDEGWRIIRPDPA